MKDHEGKIFTSRGREGIQRKFFNVLGVLRGEAFPV
jgi:hypothetical protein